MPVVTAGVIFIIGGVLQTACQNRGMMLAGRFFAGMGIGFLGVLAPRKPLRKASDKNNADGPVYQSEIGMSALGL